MKTIEYIAVGHELVAIKETGEEDIIRSLGSHRAAKEEAEERNLDLGENE